LIEALDILRYTFVIAPCRPFYTNKRLELTKSPKFYFVAAELLKKEVALRYWRTKSKAEVDFIIESQGNQVPVEVKSTLKNPAITRSFRSFLKKYNPPRAVVASENLYANKVIADTSVHFRPLWAALQDQ